MHPNVTVSRRKVVALAAGAVAASAGPLATGVTQPAQARLTAQTADTAALLAQSRRHLLELLAGVRSAGASTRHVAFGRFTSALHTYDIAAEVAFRATEQAASKGRITALFRRREPHAMLANVIVRELEASPSFDAAWMTRFNDLEAVIQLQPAIA